MLSFRVFWRRLNVLKFGTARPRSINRSKLSTKPPRHGHSDQWRSHGSICLSAMPNSTFIVKQVGDVIEGGEKDVHAWKGLQKGDPHPRIHPAQDRKPPRIRSNPKRDSPVRRTAETLIRYLIKPLEAQEVR